jgi:hypothetical protein
VEVVSFGKSTSARIIESADDFVDLDINPRKYLISVNSRAQNSKHKNFQKESDHSAIAPQDA